MNFGETVTFFHEALEMRNLEQEELILIFKAEDIDPSTASVRRCKEAVIKYQYLDDDDTWEWQTDQERVIKTIRDRMPT